jgi:hypothetical protein
MAVRTIHDCDRCQATDIKPISFAIDGNPVDVCWACAEALLTNLMSQLDHTSALAVLKAIMKKG